MYSSDPSYWICCISLYEIWNLSETDAGRILINGKIAKASQAVNAGDIIEVTFGNRPIKVRVLSDVEPRTKDVAREMYEVIAE